MGKFCLKNIIVCVKLLFIMYIKLKERISHKLWRKLVKKERRRIRRTKLACQQDGKPIVDLNAFEDAAAIKDDVSIGRHGCFEFVKRLQSENGSQEPIKVVPKEPTITRVHLPTDVNLNSKATHTCNLPPTNPDPPSDHNPEAPKNYHRPPSMEHPANPCPFFRKVGACRFGHFCSRDHEYPSKSKTILLPNMYTHIAIDGDLFDDYDTDIALEFSEREHAQHLREFISDALGEFKRCGEIVRFYVCCNKSAHLRGNVYIHYATHHAAKKALGLFNGRWYAGRQLTCLLVSIDRWSGAICGLYRDRKCPKGNECNFLHVYETPRRFLHSPPRHKSRRPERSHRSREK